MTQDEPKFSVPMQRCSHCAAEYVFSHDCVSPSPVAQMTVMRDRLTMVESAYKAACAFIDAHVGDPDMPQKMRDTYAEFVRLRKELEKT